MDDAARLQQVLDELVSDGVVGALAELCDETSVWKLSSGLAELGTSRPVDPAGWFRIGSLTKVFTAVVVLQLVGEGRLGLDDTVERWVPDVVPDADRITVRQLLNHTAGLYNNTRDLTVDGILRDRHRHWTPREVVEQACGQEREFPPGTSRAYNNTGYVLLGMVIEQVTGIGYAEQIAQRILRPLNLRHTRADDRSVLLPEPHARAYLAVDGTAVDITECSPSPAGSAGGMVSTAAELNRFFAALLAGDLLTADLLAQMQRTLPTGTAGVDGGLGLTRYTLPDGVVLWGKEGGFHGYRTWVLHTADGTRRLALSLTVALHPGPGTTELLRRLAGW